MCRNEVVIAQKHLVAGTGERTSFAYPGRDEPRIVGDRLVARGARLAQGPVTCLPAWRRCIVQNVVIAAPVPVVG